MDNLAFNKKEMAAIISLAKMMAIADGKLDNAEVSLMSKEALRFGITPDMLTSLLQYSNQMEPKDSLAIISVMTESQKRYVSAYLGTMMAVDGNIDDKEMELWTFVTVICKLPTMTIPEAILYINNIQTATDNNKKTSFFQTIINGNNNPSEGSYVFHSNSHQRYEHGSPIKGEQIGCNRDIVIEKNISGESGYSVTVKNPDAMPGSWAATPMGTKPMKIISKSDNEVNLRGYGYDKTAVCMGVPMNAATFENYGLTIYHNGQNVTHCILHMIERDVDIDYYIK